MCPIFGVEGSELCKEPLVSAGVHSTLDILVLAKQRYLYFQFANITERKSLLSFASTTLAIHKLLLKLIQNDIRGFLQHSQRFVNPR